VTLEPGSGHLPRDPAKAAAQLDEWAAQGLSAAGILAPYHGARTPAS
jgi:hypothetical protein